MAYLPKTNQRYKHKQDMAKECGPLNDEVWVTKQ